MKEEIRLIIADAHSVFRQGLRKAVEADPQIKILAEAEDGETALAMIHAHRPDVALLDLALPRLDGVGVARSLRETPLTTRLIYLTMHQDEPRFNEALRLGAEGYLLKDEAADDAASAIHAVAAGQPYISPALSALLLARAQRASAEPDLRRLTAAERRVLGLLAEYKTSKEIASLLGVSTRTIENHRANICLKLELRGAHALVKFALDHKSALL
ncbi:MAG: response regulator transcription factor [Blastocatellia bacterium]|nr:response regulator transcription factor [Blastocatellia bacterium]